MSDDYGVSLDIPLGVTVRERNTLGFYLDQSVPTSLDRLLNQIADCKCMVPKSFLVEVVSLFFRKLSTRWWSESGDRGGQGPENAKDLPSGGFSAT